MTDKAMKLITAREYVENYIKDRFPLIIINGGKCFLLDDGTIARISNMGSRPPWDALVVEYADSEQDMLNNIADDGDLFYPDEYDSLTGLAEAMMKEMDS